MKRKLIIILILIIGIFTFIWSTFDDIAKASISTKGILETNFFLDDKIIIDWLEKYHGEATNHQIILTFINWGLKNPNDFNRILKKLNNKTVTRIQNQTLHPSD